MTPQTPQGALSDADTRIWVDTEFNEHEGRHELISMALVAEDGREWYEVLPCLAPRPWVEANVMPKLGKEPISAMQFADSLQRFLSVYKAVRIIGDWPSDIALFCDALIVGPGMRIDTPELTLEVLRLDGESADPHNALADARGIRDAHRAADRRLTAEQGGQLLTPAIAQARIKAGERIVVLDESDQPRKVLRIDNPARDGACFYAVCEKALPYKVWEDGRMERPGLRLAVTAEQGGADDYELRALLAVRYAGAALYGDDGELQDNRSQPFIDFKRDSVRTIIEKMQVRSVAALTTQPQAAETELANARRTAEYWKAEHLAGNAEIERLRAAQPQAVPKRPAFLCGACGSTKKCEACRLGFNDRSKL